MISILRELDKEHPRFHKLMQIVLDSRILEIQNCLLSLIIGVIYLVNSFQRENTYEKFPQVYKYMMWMPLWVWGIVYFSAGLSHIVALYADSIWWRKHILLVKSGLWIYLSVCVLSGDRMASGGYFYFVFFLAALRSYLKIIIVNEPNLAADFFKDESTESVHLMEEKTLPQIKKNGESKKLDDLF